ncbi:hypothetical protein, partial [Pseudomonas aeruginosa]
QIPYRLSGGTSFFGRQEVGYTEPVLHRRRREFKAKNGL